MPRYAIGAGSKVLVEARSSIHDTTTTWPAVTGEVDADPETLATAGARATFTVDMTRFDAGDFLKNRKLKKDFDFDQHPQATFELTRVEDVVRTGNEFTATGIGTLRWRGRSLELRIAGKGTLDARGLTATGRFDLDIRDLGLSAPKFLMFKMSDEVSVEVTLRGEAR
jgi:polyisoprenoid-binding protein YceI